MKHVDVYLDSEDADPIAREYLEHARRPAVMKDHAWLRDNAPFVTWRAQEYRCVGASVLGDVWLKEVSTYGDGGNHYDKRVDVAELSGWRKPEIANKPKGKGKK